MADNAIGMIETKGYVAVLGAVAGRDQSEG